MHKNIRETIVKQLIICMLLIISQPLWPVDPSVFKQAQELMNAKNKLVLSIEGIKPLLNELQALNNQLKLIIDKLGFTQLFQQNKDLGGVTNGWLKSHRFPF
jgi:hypothetical protein